MPPSAASLQVRAVDWVFTIWPQDDCDFDDILGYVNDWPFKYITYQIEVGDDNLPPCLTFC